MENILNCIEENISWIFDGIGVAIITTLLGFFIKIKLIKEMTISPEIIIYKKILMEIIQEIKN